MGIRSSVAQPSNRGCGAAKNIEEAILNCASSPCRHFQHYRGAYLSFYAVLSFFRPCKVLWAIHFVGTSVICLETSFPFLKTWRIAKGLGVGVGGCQEIPLLFATGSWMLLFTTGMEASRAVCPGWHQSKVNLLSPLFTGGKMHNLCLHNTSGLTPSPTPSPFFLGKLKASCGFVTRLQREWRDIWLEPLTWTLTIF